MEVRRSPFFNRRFYEAEVVPKATTVLLFQDFMTKCLGMNRDEILNEADLGVEEDEL